MAEEQKEKQSEEYQFINEKIVSKRKKKWRKRLATVLFAIGLAILFGLVASAVFVWSEDYFRTLFGKNEKRQEVELPRPTPSPELTLSVSPEPVRKITLVPTKQQTPEPTEVPTLAPSVEATPEAPSEIPSNVGVSPAPTPEISSGTIPGEDQEKIPETENTPAPTQMPDEKRPVERTDNPEKQMYLQMYEFIRQVAENVSDTLVTVSAVETGVDWFQEVYENRTDTTGLVLGNDGVDLLILVGTEQFSGATSIEVLFDDEVISGRIYSMDKDYGLAVIAVPLEQIPEELLSQIELGVFASEEDILAGTPVIALGAPNGYGGSMEFGMITSLGSTVSVTDGEVSYFTTDILEYPQGHGFVVNLEGKILGMITHTLKENPDDGIFSAVSLYSIRGAVVKLLNNAEWAYCGIKGQDVPQNLKKEYGLENGVYVSEVENASPALAAGMKAGDIIVAVGGKEVDGIRSFSDVILGCSTREIVQVKLIRKAEDGLRKMTIEIPLTGKNKN